jgi:hypothetical protein
MGDLQIKYTEENIENHFVFFGEGFDIIEERLELLHQHLSF